MKNWLKEFVHNCIVHPAMMFLPVDKATKLHDKNADWAFGKDNRYDEITMEKQKNHNDIEFIEITDDFGYFCIDRMEEALKGEARKIPSGLTREQTREFIIFGDEIPEDIEREELIGFLNNKIKESEIEEEKFDFDIEAIEQAKKEELHTIPDFNSFEEFDEWLNNGFNNEK